MKRISKYGDDVIQGKRQRESWERIQSFFDLHFPWKLLKRDPFFLSSPLPSLDLVSGEGHEKHASREIDFQAKNHQSLVTSSSLWNLICFSSGTSCKLLFNCHHYPSLKLLFFMSCPPSLLFPSFLFSSVLRKIVTKRKKLQKNWVENKIISSHKILSSFRSFCLWRRQRKLDQT